MSVAKKIKFMKKSLPLLIFCFFFFAISVFAQEARMMDEFGEIVCDDYLYRMELITNNSKDFNGKIYIIFYEGKSSKRISPYSDKFVNVYPQRGLAKAKIQSIKDFLKVRKIPSDKFVFIEGGFRETVYLEAWSVPDGAIPPTSTPTLKKMKYRKGKAKGYCIICCGET